MGSLLTHFTSKRTPVAPPMQTTVVSTTSMRARNGEAQDRIALMIEAFGAFGVYVESPKRRVQPDVGKRVRLRTPSSPTPPHRLFSRKDATPPILAGSPPHLRRLATPPTPPSTPNTSPAHPLFRLTT